MAMLEDYSNLDYHNPEGIVFDCCYGCGFTGCCLCYFRNGGLS